MNGAAGERPTPSPPPRWGELPPDPYARPPTRLALRSLVSVLLIVMLFLLFAALSLANMTAEGPAKRGLRQSVAVLTEVDAYLDETWEELRDEAARSPPAGAVTPPDFPVAVSFRAREVLERNRDEFRALLLTRAAERIYDEGANAFDSESSNPSALSLEGAVRNGLDFLRPTPHRILTRATLAAAAVSALLAAGLVLLSRGYGRLLALGMTISVAALPFLLLAVAVRFALRFTADSLDDAPSASFLALAQELTWAAIRNGMVLSVGGGILLALGIWLTRWPPQLIAASWDGSEDSQGSSSG